jgi:hypothetical protein
MRERFDIIAKSSQAVNKCHSVSHMKGAEYREVVLEIEHIKIVRKRARTNLRECGDCKKTTDFISVDGAADLFSTTPAKLFEFTQSYVCHFRVEEDQEILLCLTDLLTAMRKGMKKGTVKLLGE